jgi:predicted transcriptional regulator
VLLDLDGPVLVVDPEGGHWVRFMVTRVPMSPEKPHGLDCSLTLRGPDGERLVGFDNAHPVARQKRAEPQDHRHRLRTIKAYDYRDAATLLGGFWTTAGRGVAREGSDPMTTLPRRTLRVGIASYEDMKARTMAVARGEPASLDELARLTGKAKSNLSRTLRTMVGYGLVRLERGERGRITPIVTHERIELDLPLTWSRKPVEARPAL